MLRLGFVRRTYSWGSTTALPAVLGREPDGRPFAEAWFGAHVCAPSPLLQTPTPGEHTEDDGVAPLPPDLATAIAQDPEGTLGEDVLARFGPRLPYLLKVIAPGRPLSLQVHPTLDRARAGYERENARSIPLEAKDRNYRDPNHKPEMLYALTPFEAVSGFRAPRRAAELFEDLEAPLAREVLATLRADPTAEGVRDAFTRLLAPDSRATPDQVDAVVASCRDRAQRGSTSPRADAIVALLAHHFPGDPGVVASLLLNPVSLRPGQALFIPAGGVHAYLSGVGVELMANSDNVLRAALTDKHVDVTELCDVVDFIAAPPIRIAPEEFHDSTRVYYAPIDDFELSVTDVGDDGAVQPLPGRGPRIVLCIDGDVLVASRSDSLTLLRGEAAFVPAAEGPLTVRGRGTVIQADVP